MLASLFWNTLYINCISARLREQVVFYFRPSVCLSSHFIYFIDGAALAAHPLSYRLQTMHDQSIMYGIHTGRCPAYLKDTIRTSSSAATRTGLRSASSSKYMTHGCAANQVRKRAFSHAGPVAWNSLPPDIRAAASPAMFKKLLKTHFLAYHFPPASF